MKTTLPKSIMSIISLITLILFISFLSTNSLAGDKNSSNSQKSLNLNASIGKSLILAKGQYYVPPPAQKDRCAACCDNFKA